jgi:hypothetical protein
MKEELLKYLKDNNKLWSYDKSKISEIDDALLIELILIYGDIKEIDLLKTIFGKEQLINVFKAKIRSNPFHENAAAYLAFDLLDELEPYKYLKSYNHVPSRGNTSIDKRDFL